LQTEWESVVISREIQGAKEETKQDKGKAEAADVVVLSPLPLNYTGTMKLMRR
jgi:hypothetical protein